MLHFDRDYHNKYKRIIEAIFKRYEVREDIKDNY